ncbi:MAG: hypothetical protein ABFD96_03355 [Armatimonadia bacterium]
MSEHCNVEQTLSIIRSQLEAWTVEIKRLEADLAIARYTAEQWRLECGEIRRAMDAIVARTEGEAPDATLEARIKSAPDDCHET